MTNEAFLRVKIDGQLRDQGWEITNTNAVCFASVQPASRSVLSDRQQMVVPVQPMVMQQAFEANVRRVEAIQQHQVNAMTRAEAAFSALLARAFSTEGAAAAVYQAEEVVS